jgi:hypothetical protein
MPPRRAKESGLPAVNSPVLLDYSEQLAILLFGQLMKWLRPMVRRGDSIPLVDLKDALWAVKEAWVSSDTQNWSPGDNKNWPLLGHDGLVQVVVHGRGACGPTWTS